MNAETAQPVSILIAALGGEGGGVLSNWLVESAMAAGFPVQSTSIPGVAQRTGATTYYLEIFPVPIDELGDREPVLTLTPGPGEIDLMIAAELLEAGRAMQNGFYSPDRTTLIASTHRLYSVAEKTVAADGRYQADTIIHAAEQMAGACLLRDYRKLSEASGSIINAVLLGAVAPALPFGKEVLEQTIRQSGIAVEAQGRPYREQVRRNSNPCRNWFPGGYCAPSISRIRNTAGFTSSGYDDVTGKMPAWRIIPLTRKAAKNLALWMAYEDVVRVADLKTRSERISRIRKEVHARTSDLVEVVDYLKPGIEELCALLPKFIATPLLEWASRKTGSSACTSGCT